MARYKRCAKLTASDEPMFKETYAPGTLAPHSGIYRCAACGQEAVSTEGHKLPPTNTHAHGAATDLLTPTHWTLIVAPEHRSGR